MGAQRILSLLITPIYFLIFIFGLRYGAEVPFAYGVPSVILGSLAIMISMLFLSVRFSELKEQSNRFSLSTVFLVSIPVCIYLAALRLFIRHVPAEESDPPLWFSLVSGTVFYVCFTTVVLLSFTEAIVWIAARIVSSRSRRRNRSID